MNKETLYDKTWKKCIIVFIVIFLIVSVIGGLTITYLDDFISDKHFYTDYIVVQNKSMVNYDFYTVIDINNKSYIINNDNGTQDRKIYNKIETNKRYKVVLQDPQIKDTNTTYIIQVYNDTG